MAVERFSTLGSKGVMTPIVQLARDSGRAAAVVSRAIVSAFREGLVDVRPTGVTSGPQLRVEYLESQLLTEFRGLREAVVVALRDRSSPIDDSTYLRKADEAHAMLGSAMAELIWRSRILRDGDVVGVGAGRGVYHTVEAMASLPRIRASNITLGSLTGSCLTTHQASKMNLRLDADFHVGMLGPCFADEVRMHFMSHSIVHSTETDAGNMLGRTWLARVGSPTVALLGIGALTRGHQFFEQAEAPKDIREPTFDPVLQVLRALVRVSNAFTSPRYCPVADIAHRFFFVTPPQGEGVPVEAKQEIMRLIGELNSRLHTISEVQLKRVPTIMLVAGSIIKAQAIRTLLNDPDFRVRYLAVDEATARRILASGRQAI
jgi:DNA-binding transcriptional regulator LsrR (DeoR family)